MALPDGTVVKIRPANAGDTRDMGPWVRKIPWRRNWLPIPVFLPGKIPRTEELRRVQSMSHTCTHTFLTKTDWIHLI